MVLYGVYDREDNLVTVCETLSEVAHFTGNASETSISHAFWRGGYVGEGKYKIIKFKDIDMENDDE